MNTSVGSAPEETLHLFSVGDIIVTNCDMHNPFSYVL